MYSNSKTLPPEFRRSLSQPEFKPQPSSSSSGSGFHDNVQFGAPPDNIDQVEKKSHRPPSAGHPQKRLPSSPPNHLQQQKSILPTSPLPMKEKWVFEWNGITIGIAILSFGLAFLFCLLDLYIMFQHL